MPRGPRRFPSASWSEARSRIETDDQQGCRWPLFWRSRTRSNPGSAMTDLTVAQLERAALAGAMLELGADAPTLCEGWTNYDMAAHVVVREHKVIASIGI